VLEPVVAGRERIENRKEKRNVKGKYKLYIMAVIAYIYL